MGCRQATLRSQGPPRPGLGLDVDLSTHRSALSLPLSSSSACSLPHPRERLGAGPAWAGWGAVVIPSHPGSLILSGRVSWLWAPSRAAALCCRCLCFPPSLLRPDRFNFCQQLWKDRLTGALSPHLPPSALALTPVPRVLSRPFPRPPVGTV